MSTGKDVERRHGVVAIVTAFNPGEDLVRVCRSVSDQVGRLVVVDDGSTADVTSVLDQCRSIGVEVLRHDANRGIAAALNTGLAAVQDHHPTHVLTLDQDSLVPDGYVDALLGAADAVGPRRVAMVAPGAASGVRTYAKSTEDAQILDLEPIQSGLMLVQDAVAELGPFEEDLFIDGVDTEYWLRARAAGWASVVTPSAALTHQLGRRHTVRILGRELPVTHAAPFRYYYIARNRVVLVRRHGRREKRWAIGAVGRDIRHLLITSVLVPGRRRRWLATFAGLRDGFRNRLGPRGSAER